MTVIEQVTEDKRKKQRIMAQALDLFGQLDPHDKTEILAFMEFLLAQDKYQTPQLRILKDEDGAGHVYCNGEPDLTVRDLILNEEAVLELARAVEEVEL